MHATTGRGGRVTATGGEGPNVTGPQPAGGDRAHGQIRIEAPRNTVLQMRTDEPHQAEPQRLEELRPQRGPLTTTPSP